MDIFLSGPIEYKGLTAPSLGHLLLYWKVSNVSDQVEVLKLDAEKARDLVCKKDWALDFSHYLFTALFYYYKKNKEKEIPQFSGLPEIETSLFDSVRDSVYKHFDFLDSLPEARGAIFLLPLSWAKRVYAEKYLITRVQKDIKGIYNLQAFAPSAHLFSLAKKKWKKYPKWFYWPVYEAIYRQEIEKEKDLLSKFCKQISAGTKIAFLCYCKSPRFCHRSILGSIFQEKGCYISYSTSLPLYVLNPSLFL